MGSAIRWTEVGTVEEFSETDRKAVSVEGQSCILFKVGDEFFAVSALCTHARILMTDGALNGYELECPQHGARFDIRNGRVLTPPAVRGLKTFKVRVQDGRIRVCP
jgi:nitrite reductase/ring-hydroxylating ferredoxin subunit